MRPRLISLIGPDLYNPVREGRISTTAKMATPEHLEKESGMLIYGGQMEDNKHTAFGPSHQEWPRGSEEMSVSALLDLV